MREITLNICFFLLLLKEDNCEVEFRISMLQYAQLYKYYYNNNLKITLQLKLII